MPPIYIFVFNILNQFSGCKTRIRLTEESKKAILSIIIFRSFWIYKYVCAYVMEKQSQFYTMDLPLQAVSEAKLPMLEAEGCGGDRCTEPLLLQHAGSVGLQAARTMLAPLERWAVQESAAEVVDWGGKGTAVLTQSNQHLRLLSCWM